MKRSLLYVLHLLHSLVAWVWLFVVTISLGMIAVILGIFRLENMVHKMAYLWAYLILPICGVYVQIEGKDNIYRKGPIIIIANHQSMFDILVFYLAMNIQFRWLAKKSLFRIPIFGWAMKGAGYIPVERFDKKQALSSLIDAVKAIQKGKSVLIFPEGTRTKDPRGKMLPFKKGAFLLAKKSQVVLQPVTIWGATRVLPKSDRYWIQRIFPGKVIVIIHKPIFPQEYKNLRLEDLSNRIRSIIEEPMKRLESELPLTEAVH